MTWGELWWEERVTVKFQVGEGQKNEKKNIRRWRKRIDRKVWHKKPRALHADISEKYVIWFKDLKEGQKQVIWQNPEQKDLKQIDHLQFELAKRGTVANVAWQLVPGNWSSKVERISTELQLVHGILITLDVLPPACAKKARNRKIFFKQLAQTPWLEWHLNTNASKLNTQCSSSEGSCNITSSGSHCFAADLWIILFLRHTCPCQNLNYQHQ